VDLLILAMAGFATSLTTAVIGLGGGVALMLVMPGLMPLAAIIPVHAFVQFVSNAARVGFAFHHVDFRLLLPLICGSVLGAAIGSPAVGVVSFAVLPAIAGIIIVLVVWLPHYRLIPKGRAALFALGAYQTGLGMVAGATGPLGAVVLNRMNTEREWLVVHAGLYDHQPWREVCRFRAVGICVPCLVANDCRHEFWGHPRRVAWNTIAAVCAAKKL
jgi:hypothetical protein